MNIEDYGTFDVCVAGGGTAGFCAAAAAARTGAKTVLIEKFGCPGGTITVLGSGSIDEFVNPHKSGDRMVIKGIAWEFVTRLAAMGYAHIPDMNAPFTCNQQYGVGVNPAAAAKLMDDMLIESGVRILYRAQLVDVETVDITDEKSPDFGRKCVKSAIISTKTGLKRVKASYFIDTTGDGDLCLFAGADYMLGDNDNTLQPGTLRYYIKNEQMFDVNFEEGNRMFAELKSDGKISDDELLYGADFRSIVRSNGENTNHVFDLEIDDIDKRTQAEINARRQVFKISEALRKTNTNISISGIAPETASRESRRITADTVITKDDYVNCRKWNDSVCYSYWFIDLHAKGNYSAKHIFLNSEQTPTIPLSSMTPVKLTNVFTAGKIISCDRAANSAIRIKATCMADGECAGTAAAICALNKIESTRKINIDILKGKLRSNGVIVPD